MQLRGAAWSATWLRLWLQMRMRCLTGCLSSTCPLAMPHPFACSFMNVSGEAVGKLARFYRVGAP